MNKFFQNFKFNILLWRYIPVDNSVINKASQNVQLPIKQVIFLPPKKIKNQKDFEKLIYQCLVEFENFNFSSYKDFFPCSLSSSHIVYKGRLISNEIIPYFKDLSNPNNQVIELIFHTRFSTNTAPNVTNTQPFQWLAHNGELNTDRKNRINEEAIALKEGRKISYPDDLSDSGYFDKTLNHRLMVENIDIIEAINSMSPPAWENDPTLTEQEKAMFKYFSLYTEKIDGPAAILFGDGKNIGAKLDRLGLRPLRSVETEDYLCVMSEAGQINFDPKTIINYGRVKAGGIITFNLKEKKIYTEKDIIKKLVDEKDYLSLLKESTIHIDSLEKGIKENEETNKLTNQQRYIAYFLNQESFKFFLDPMLQTGLEKVSAMGYGLAPNIFNKKEGGMSKFFSQKFAQVTNPPLDSIRETDGMTLQVSLGAKPNFVQGKNKQILINEPILSIEQITKIKKQSYLKLGFLDATFSPEIDALKSQEMKKSKSSLEKQCEQNLYHQIENLCEQAILMVKDGYKLLLLSDSKISDSKIAIPIQLIISAINQSLIKAGLRFNTSLIIESGQIISSHDLATSLGFGASAVYPSTVIEYIKEKKLSETEQNQYFKNYCKAMNKALMKTMGKFGLCTLESYIGGEFFEANFLDTQDKKLAKYFPNINSPIGGVQFKDIAINAVKIHLSKDLDIPNLGLFKERENGPGHTFGSIAVKEFTNMTQEKILYNQQNAQDLKYQSLKLRKLTPKEIDSFVSEITPSYKKFIDNLYEERSSRPARLRDLLFLPIDLEKCKTEKEFKQAFSFYDLKANINFIFKGLILEKVAPLSFSLKLKGENIPQRLKSLESFLKNQYKKDISSITIKNNEFLLLEIEKNKNSSLVFFIERIINDTHKALDLKDVQACHKITKTFASGAMSHGALHKNAHEAVAQGINIVGGLSNSGEGGEESSRFNSIKSCRIKQLASGRFGVWVGYLADPNLTELEIKIAQGAKPGEGGQLPAKKVNVTIAGLRGGTPQIELVSPPPHHDIYSIEDLAQLIHDAKASRVKVTVKLVSSEGVGIIAVGVAKAGADVINIAGSSGGTGAAAVSSLKNTGRIAEIGIAEVHQALCTNGIREKVLLRCSSSHQTGLDVVKSAILGADSFEFGTSALMMLKCVMAKNCNVKCPAGLTTNPEFYEGEPRALAQYFINLAQEVRTILASLGYKSLREIRGETQLLHLSKRSDSIGQLDCSELLAQSKEIKIVKPKYLEAYFNKDEFLTNNFKKDIIKNKTIKSINFEGEKIKLSNCDKTFGGRFSIDIERVLNYKLNKKEREFFLSNIAIKDERSNRLFLKENTITVHTKESAGQSYGAFNNNGLTLIHKGTCNDGVGKSMSGGTLVIKNPRKQDKNNNVLIGNFALFGATGGKVFINGEAGDRFAVRNSGSLAVVEGVGDFACEYMTNGLVINLGTCGKGFANGMSGGNIFQYDKNDTFKYFFHKEYIKVIQLEQSSYLTQILHKILTEHYQLTQSQKAKYILNNWEKEKNYFKYAIPYSLYETQNEQYIIKNTNREAMIGEMAHKLALKPINTICNSYEKQQFVFEGITPKINKNEFKIASELITTYYTFIKTAKILENTPFIGLNNLEKNIQKIISSGNKKILDPLFILAKQVFDKYSDEQLSILLAKSRLDDYKQALTQRDTIENYAYGAYHWIITRQLELNKKLKSINNPTQELAQKASKEFTKNLLFPSEGQIFSQKQRDWLNGFLFSINEQFHPQEQSKEQKDPFYILYGTQTGNSEGLAFQFESILNKNKIPCKTKDMGSLSVNDFLSMKKLFIIISTYGEGDMPDSVESLWLEIQKKKNLNLSHLSYSVLALGDSSYTHFCLAGKNWDKKLSQLGATQLTKRTDCDVDFEKPATEWMKNCLAKISSSKSLNLEHNNKRFTAKNPYSTHLKKKILLSKENSSKEIWHYEIALEDEALAYDVGDCIAIIPKNSLALAQSIVKTLGYNQEIITKNGTTILSALQNNYEIRQASKKLLTELAKTNAKLKKAMDEGSQSLKNYLWARETINLLQETPKFKPTPDELLAFLFPLKARIYSISSSYNKHFKEVHLTIASVRYESFGFKHNGVCSTFLADDIIEGQEILVYPIKNKNFKLPSVPSTKIIMVGPGTGIAPFRAFLQEREISKATGENWLFFGDRNKKYDFLYEEEFKEWQKSKLLTKLDLAFSRDQKHKVYVQNKMLENGKEFFQWLEDGAYFYVCGDAHAMAKDVDKTLHQIIEKYGKFSKDKAEEYVQKLKKDKRYLKDVY